MRTKRVLRAAVAFLFAFGVLAADLAPLRLPLQTASAVTQADIDKLKKESNALSSKKSEVNKQLSALKKDKANTLKRKALLDQQIDLISDRAGAQRDAGAGGGSVRAVLQARARDGGARDGVLLVGAFPVVEL